MWGWRRHDDGTIHESIVFDLVITEYLSIETEWITINLVLHYFKKTSFSRTTQSLMIRKRRSPLRPFCSGESPSESASPLTGLAKASTFASSLLGARYPSVLSPPAAQKRGGISLFFWFAPAPSGNKDNKRTILKKTPASTSRSPQAAPRSLSLILSLLFVCVWSTRVSTSHSKLVMGAMVSLCGGGRYPEVVAVETTYHPPVDDTFPYYGGTCV